MANRKSERKSRRKRKPVVQAPAGTIATEADAHASTVHVLAYGPSGLEELRECELAKVPELRRKWPVLWLHVIGLGDASLIARLGEEFGLHALALDDVVHTHQRPKVQRFGDVTQIVVRIVEDIGSPDTEQLSVFVGKGFVVSFEERREDIFEVVRQRIRDRAQQLTPRLRTLKHQMLGLRRALWPMREVLGSLAADESHVIGDEARMYLRDCQDHAAQLLDILTVSRELATDLRDLELSVASQRLNEVMKVLTIMATLFIPLTFICSIYGMNFDPGSSPLNMPELRWYFGYPFALSLMAITAIALLIYFRRKGWL
jgi:magnesium transporter